MYLQKRINGINIVAYKIPHIYSVYISIWVKSGSIYENKENNGISHFIEHMVFKGSKYRSGKQIAEESDSIGAQINGFTEKDNTCFYIKALNTYQEKAVNILFDMVFNPAFEEDEINKEKNVVIEEILEETDSPEEVAYNNLDRISWGKSSLGLPILGSIETVNNFTKQTLINYYNERFTSDNIVIAIAGNYNDEIFKIMEEYLKKINKSKISEILYNNEWHNGFIFLKKEIEQVNVCIGMPSVNFSFENIYPLSIINNAFGGGVSSRLFQKIREEKGLVYSIYSYPSAYLNGGALSVFFSCGVNNLIESYDLVLKEIEKISMNGFTEKEIDKFKEHVRINVLMDMDSTSSRMMDIGKSELLLNRIYTLEDVLSYIEKINYNDINQIAKKIFNVDNISTSVVGNIQKDKIRWLEYGK
ncbi:MAG: M16 family metallopeptidase [Thermoanaerobacteraceae bacterium]